MKAFQVQLHFRFPLPLVQIPLHFESLLRIHWVPLCFGLPVPIHLGLLLMVVSQSKSHL